MSERPSTEEQRRRRALNRCPNLAPEVKDGPWRQASRRQCIKKKGHEGPCKLDFGWAHPEWWPDA